MKYFILIIMTLVTAIGCSKEGDDRLEQRSGIEEKGRIQAEEERAQKMVEDLLYQSQFYESLYGEYEGEIQTNSGVLGFKLTLVPHHPIFIPENRKLTVREAEELLIKQSFNIQTLVILDTGENRTAAGCQFEQVKGDLKGGEFFLLEDNCDNVFSLAINDPSINSSTNTNERYKNAINEVAASLSVSILNGEVTEVSEIVGEMRPSRRAIVYPFRLKRVEQ